MGKTVVKSIAVNISRLAVALTFIFSGYVKAIDPMGTQYKLHDYLKALGIATFVPDFVTLTTSILLATIELSLGVFLLFAIRRRMVTKIVLAFMLIMTLITIWIALANPVKDCGCFGDAIKLTNIQTLVKNIILLTCSTIVAIWPTAMVRFISRTNQWIAINYTIIYGLATSAFCLYHLPIFDFRPYHIGANIPKGMEIPEGAQQPEFKTTFLLKKNGITKEFSLENYPDSTWTFVDSKTVQTKQGYVPPIHDLSMEVLETGEDITDSILSNKDYTFLLISPYLEQANDSYFGDINKIYDYAQLHNYGFYCLTASNRKSISHWQDITGAEYPFLLTDETTLRTIIRSNPGLLLLKNGTIIGKWSHNNLPQLDDTAQQLDKRPEGQLQQTNIGEKIAYTLAWFFLPLTLLALADRTWAWTKWIRKHKSFFNISKKHEKENCSR